MKKILAIVLALCLALSLSVSVFATNSPAPDKGTPSNPVGGSTAATSKYIYSVTSASGSPLTATVNTVDAGEIYDEVKNAGVVALYYINITSAVNSDEIVSIDVYAPGVTADCAVIVRDAWEILPEVTFTANGNRATITGPAGVFNKWHYVAIVSKADVIVEIPQEDTKNDEDNENVDETPVVDVEGDEDNTPVADSNPGTGVALAVVPMIVAAAAVVVSKRR